MEPKLLMLLLGNMFKCCNITAASMNADGSHPCAPVALRLWPQILAALNVYSNEWRTVERTNQCLRYVVRCLGNYSLPIIPEVINVMSQFFEATKHGSCLYVVDGLVDVSSEGSGRAARLFYRATYSFADLWHATRAAGDAVRAGGVSGHE